MKNRRPLSIANRHPRLRIDRRTIAAAIATLDIHAAKFRGGCPPGELSLVFLTDKTLAQLHGQFLDDPTITDVITFEGESDPRGPTEEKFAGEICVSADAAQRHVFSQKKSRNTRRDADAFANELTLYVVHGWLHLAGYDDLQPARKREMRRAEARAMKLLRAAGDLPRFALRA
jgi:probable rRNA maturation factor